MRYLTLVGSIALSACFLACSTSAAGGSAGAAFPADATGDAQAHGQVDAQDGHATGDGGSPGDTSGDPVTDAGSDVAAADSSLADGSAGDGAADGATEVADTVFDTGLDPEDTGSDAVDAKADTSTSPQGLGTLYAHTSSTLYRLDPAGFAKVADFQFDKNQGSMTDIALDQSGVLYGVTFGDLFQCDKATAKCNWLAGLPGQFNGLTFVPKGTVKPNEEALIGIGNDGSWNLVDFSGGKATIKKLGEYGGGLTSSGDAFSVEGIGTYATVKSGFFGNDSLASIDPLNGSATVLGNIGESDLWGFAWYQGTFYGFASGGGVYAINLGTAKATPAKFPVPSGLSWWGAGVSTRANGTP